MTQDEIIEMAREAGFKMENSAAMQAAKAFYKLATAKELESQEPAATLAVREHAPVGKVAYVLEVDLPVGIHKLYTHPPQRTGVGLTQIELDELDEQSPSLHDFVQNLMSKLKQKNG